MLFFALNNKNLMKLIENILNNNNLIDNDGDFINILDFYNNQELYLFYKDDDSKIYIE